MENTDTTVENTEAEAVENTEKPQEETKTNQDEEGEPMETSIEEPVPPQQSENPTENGDEEIAKPEMSESQKEPENEIETAADEVATLEPEEKADDKVESEQEVPKARPVRTTRGTKRKADEKNESTNDIGNETLGEKENLESKNGENLENENNLTDEVSIKSGNIMGKGKRARIPNKRYSEILLTPNKKSSLPSTPPQSKTNSSELQLDIQIKEEPLDIEVKKNHLPVVRSPGLPKKGSRSSTSKEDLQDPKYQKPFKFGWKRELVWRSTSNSLKRLGDIYYYTPAGKKVRSFRELSDHLNNKSLSLDNFSFTKESLGVNDPEKEIIRNAKIPKSESFSESFETKKLEIKKPKKPLSPKSNITDSPKPAPKAAASTVAAADSSSSASTAPPSTAGTPTTPATPGRARRAAAAALPTVIHKEKLVKGASPSPSKKAAASTTTTPGKKPLQQKMPIKKGQQGQNKGPPAKKAKLAVKSEEPAKVETPKVSPRVGKTSKCQPCSIRCEGLEGIIPTLQCRQCLCLYHHECIGLTSDLEFPYVCKNCHEQSQTPVSADIASPPPLTPINTLKATATSPVNVPPPPKLHRIPRPDSLDPIPILTPAIDVPTTSRDSPPLAVTSPIGSPPIISPPPLTPKSLGSPTRSLVGSVTSWLPQNVKLVGTSEVSQTPRPQYVEYIGGKKYLVIPKHNVMAVSSSGAPEAPNTPPITRPTSPKEAAPSEVKKEPMSPAGGSDEAMEGTRENIEEESSGVKPIEPTPPTPSKPKKKPPINLKSISNINTAVKLSDSEKNETSFMENYLQNLSFGYNTLLYVFQYLKVQDLLKAGCVCTMWRDIASHPILWRTVRMKNSQVHSFEGLANTLKKHGTVHLDLRKMLLPNSGDDIWPEFSQAIARVDSLRKIELCRCPASVVEQLATTNPFLEVINAVTIKCESMNLDPLKSLRCIRELRIKSTTGLNINSINSLKELVTLKILSITSINDLHKFDLSVIAELKNLESLDLGECSDFPKDFGQDILMKLDKLEKLRLEKGQGNCHTFEILDAVKNMKNLEQLELVNFDVKTGFDKAIGGCRNIKKLMIIPTYISQSATTNNMVLSGVLRLQGYLTHFVWGVTLELLRVTELFVDQCEDSNKKEKKPSGTGDSIPVLKPVPDLSNGGAIQTASNPPQVEILPLPNLQKLLMNSLPGTRVKILKIPFHATWRQTLTDSV
ncbi:proteoglycan 4-like [Anthonomus grandis grandis]|uniref:proteoglycan 4-like n=1 Tax=Anthonomus grandis grandis TaxID=2921223 RepID=UPI0021664BF8|nr:proteoglycan 4-like [Anthonomus grandis grandis]